MKIKTLLRLGQGVLGLFALGLGSVAEASNFDLRFVNPGGCPAATSGAVAAVGNTCRYRNVVVDSTGAALPATSIYQRDVIIKLEKLVGGAVIRGTATNPNAWDNDGLRLNAATTGITYPQFFTPTITAPNTANATSWAEFSFQFVASDGTSTATLPLPGTFYMTSFDTDTNGAVLREFIEYIGASGSGLANPTSDQVGAAVDGGTNYEATGTSIGSGIADNPIYKASAQFSTPGLVKFAVGARQGVTSCNANNNATNGSCERLSAYSFQIADSVFLSPSVDGYKSVQLTNDADGNGVISAGDTLTYTVAYVNTGNAAVSNFQITDTLPPGLTVVIGAQTVTGAAKNSAYNGNTDANLLASGQSLAAGGSVTVSIPVTVGTVADGATVLNQAVAATGVASVNSDNVDSTTVFPPSVTAAGVSVPAGSLTQTQAVTVDKTSVVVRRSPQLTLNKTVVGRSNASDQFTVQIRNGATVTASASTSGAGTTATTNAVTLTNNATYTLTEVGAGGANLANYGSALTCTNAATGSTTALPSGAGQSFTVTPRFGDVITCTLTNTAKLPTLTIGKISNGGIGTFAFSGDNGFGSQNVTTTTDGMASAGTKQTLSAANSATTITETPLAGYVLASATCTGMGSGGAATLSGNVLTLSAAATAPGSDITCTFVNNRSPNITLLKLGRNSTQNAAFVDQTGTVGAKPGDTVEYCIVYTNAGGVAPNFKLTDNVPAGLNALTDGYVAGKGIRWADGIVIAAGATAAPVGTDLTSASDPDQGSLTTTLGLGKGVMTLDLGAAGLSAGGKGTVCFRARVP